MSAVMKNDFALPKTKKRMARKKRQPNPQDEGSEYSNRYSLSYWKKKQQELMAICEHSLEPDVWIKIMGEMSIVSTHIRAHEDRCKNHEATGLREVLLPFKVSRSTFHSNH